MRKSTKGKLALLIMPLLFAAVAATAYLALRQQDTRTSAGDPEGELVLSPEEVTKSPGEEFVVTVTADPDGSNDGTALAVDAVLEFDPSQLEVVRVDPGALPGTYPMVDSPNGIDNENGIVRVSWLAYDTESATVLNAMQSPQPIGTVTFKVKTPTNPATAIGTDITIDFNGEGQTTDSNIVYDNEGDPADSLTIVGSVAVNGGGIDTGGDTGGDNGGNDGGSGDDGGTGGDNGGNDGGSGDGGTVECTPNDYTTNEDNSITCNQEGCSYYFCASACYPTGTPNSTACPSDDGGDNGGDNGGNTNIDGDINNDGKVSISDYSILLGDYLACKDGSTCNSRSDLTGDGKISISDYAKFLQFYNENN